MALCYRKCFFFFSTSANLFEGNSERKLPLFSIEGIYSRLFQVVGKMVAYLIVHLDIECLGMAWKLKFY